MVHFPFYRKQCVHTEWKEDFKVTTFNQKEQKHIAHDIVIGYVLLLFLSVHQSSILY